MADAKRVRVIKKGGAAAREAEAARDINVSREQTVTPGREVREVVSDWVRDHQRRADEFRRNYSTLLGEVGFKSAACCGRAA
jgi:hypothetical protein